MFLKTRELSAALREPGSVQAGSAEGGFGQRRKDWVGFLLDCSVKVGTLLLMVVQLPGVSLAGRAVSAKLQLQN